MGEINIRLAIPGDDEFIHEAHMRSIREICIKDHGESEIRGWGYRALDNRWVKPINAGNVNVVEQNGKIYGFSYLRISAAENDKVQAHLHALYLTPEIVGRGFGLKLAQLMLNKAKNAGAKTITLQSSITAHGFYKRLGFQDAGTKQLIDIGGYPVSSFPMSLTFK
jgi:predicted N-acetyltransferase YhbS